MEHRITHACGHEQAHYIPGYPAQQDRKARWLRTTRCRACFIADRRAAEGEAAAGDGAAVAGLALAGLAGSERQVAWATAIRAKRLAGLVRDGLIGEAPGHPCCAIGDARWWIDHRDDGDGDLLRKAERAAAMVVGAAAIPRAA